MIRKYGVNMKSNVDKVKNSDKKSKNSNIKKVNKVKKNDNIEINNKKKDFLKYKRYDRNDIISLFMLLCDVAVVIFCALKNKVQYVNIMDRDILIGETRDMLLGKNYVVIIITLFFFVYYLWMNRLIFKKSINLKRMALVLMLLFFINCMFFYVFTVRIY